MPETSLVTRGKRWLAKRAYGYLSSIYSYSGNNYPWWPGAVLESFTGAFQQNVIAAPATTLLAFPPVYACVTGIAQDVGKMRLKLSRNVGGIWEEITENQPWLRLLREPNHYQDIQQFIEHWVISKLIYGNTYVFKIRDDRGVVSELYILHPSCIKPLQSPTGAVFYEIQRDDLSTVTLEKLDEIQREYGTLAIPESEIIHDRINPLWHPLIGVSPLYACGDSATLGAAIQSAATTFFQNKGMPGAHMSAPGAISDETAERIKATFQAAFTGSNSGKVLITGDDLKFTPLAFSADKSQQKEQLDQVINAVAIAFRYPLWKLTGSTPPYTKPDQAQTMYYTDCLGPHIVAIEKRLDRGLELPLNVHCEFDLDELMRMDQSALYESLNAAGKFMKLNEQRFRANLDDLDKGGDTVYRQEQDHSVEWVHDMDEVLLEQAKKPKPEPEPVQPALPPTPDPDIERDVHPDLLRDALAFRLQRRPTA